MLNRRKLLNSLFALTSLSVLPSFAKDGSKHTSKFTELFYGGFELWEALKNSPYVSEGKGEILYIFMSSNCSYSKQLLREQKPLPTGIEYLWILGPYEDTPAESTAQVAYGRRLKDFYLAMNNLLIAPPLRNSDERIRAFNSIVLVTKTYKNISRSNGLRGGTPGLIWLHQSKIYAYSGYSYRVFSEITDFVRGAA